MLNIKILGTGCTRCQLLTNRVQEVVNEYHIDATVVNVQDLAEIMAFNIMATPALVIDEEVKTKGQMLSKNEILQLIKQHTELAHEIKT